MDIISYSYLMVVVQTEVHLPPQRVHPWRNPLTPSLSQRRTKKQKQEDEHYSGIDVKYSGIEGQKIEMQNNVSVQKSSILYCFTFSLSFSLHHLSFLVRVCPNTFTCKKRYEDNFSVLFLFYNLFCSESNEIGPVGSKWNLAPQLKLTVLAVHLKTK